MIICFLLFAYIKMLAIVVWQVRRLQFGLPFLCPGDVVSLLDEQAVGVRQLMNLSVEGTTLSETALVTLASLQRLRSNTTRNIRDKNYFVSHYQPRDIASSDGIASPRWHRAYDLGEDLEAFGVQLKEFGVRVDEIQPEISSTGNALLSEVASYRRRDGSVLPFLPPWIGHRQPADLLSAYLSDVDAYESQLYSVDNVLSAIETIMIRLQYFTFGIYRQDKHAEEDHDRHMVATFHTGMLSDCKDFVMSASAVLEQLLEQVERRRALVLDADRHTCSPFALSASSVFRSRDLDALLGSYTDPGWWEEWIETAGGSTGVSPSLND